MRDLGTTYQREESSITVTSSITRITISIRMDTTVVSAPGKVLITGGYLILEQPNAGLVLSTSARFYAIVKPLHSAEDTNNWAWSWTDVKIISPQMLKESVYKLSLRNFALQRGSHQSDNGNAFVEQAVQLAIAAAKLIVQDNEEQHELLQKLLLKGFEITIFGSNDFYSYRKQIEASGLPLHSKTLASISAFSPITLNFATLNNSSEAMLPEVAKTGLGSSAAMTTAVVACILQYLGAVNLPKCMRSAQQWQKTRDLDITDILSQVAHCTAQGKIGSGFDVSAAVYGSQRYVRFSPSILSTAQAKGNELTPLETVKMVLQENWDGEKEEYGLPPLFSLVVGEPGAGGSHTPSMVGAVERWRKTDPDRSAKLWAQLAQANTDVERCFRRLKQLYNLDKNKYQESIQFCKDLSATQWAERGAIVASSKEVVVALLESRQAFLRVRSFLRELGDMAGVPIEPPSQCLLLNATMDIKGVLFAGVPGAGGYDAVFAIALDNSVRERIEEMWCSKGVLPLCVGEDAKGVHVEDKDPRECEATNKMFSLSIS